MKKLLLSLSFCFLATLIWSQATDLAGFNQGRLQRQKTGMIILGSWAVGNIALGGALAGSRQGEDKYFHLMNAGWNVINLGIATAGYLSALKADPAGFDLYQSVQEQHQLQKILLFNAGLDLGYMAGGLYLIERSKNTDKKPEQLKGFGRSIILQGAFLFVFDVASHVIHARHNVDLQPWLSSLYFSGDQVGLVVRF